MTIYRYHGKTDHFYTHNWYEVGTKDVGATGHHGYKTQGIAFRMEPTQVAGSVPLYRYWNAKWWDHFYTTNWNTIAWNGKTGNHGFIYEGVAGFCFPSQKAGTVPLYRYFHGGVMDHYYTTDARVLGTGRHGWHYEGVECYVYP